MYLVSFMASLEWIQWVRRNPYFLGGTHKLKFLTKPLYGVFFYLVNVTKNGAFLLKHQHLAQHAKMDLYTYKVNT